MHILRISLFGRFEVQSDHQVLASLNASQAQDLFCYLPIYRHCSHTREKLADLLWGDSPTTQSGRYLRRVLWRLQPVLDLHTKPSNNILLLVEPEWVQINPQANFQLDVETFEQAFAAVSGRRGQDLD